MEMKEHLSKKKNLSLFSGFYKTQSTEQSC